MEFDPSQPEEAQPQLPARPTPTIRPLSSEDSIRRETETPTISPDTSEVHVQDPGSRLIAEPLNARQPLVQPRASSVAIGATAPKKRSWYKLLMVLIVVLVAAGYYGFNYFFADRVTIGNLVEERVNSTSYLRPQQWKKIDASTSAYGNMHGENDKSSALVAINVGNSSSLSGATPTDGFYDMVRTATLDELTPEWLKGTMNKNAELPCQNVTSFEKKADTSKTATSIGMFRVSASCQRSDGRFEIHLRGIIGNDGKIRVIMLVATESIWNKDQAAFNKMLDSITQSSSSI